MSSTDQIRSLASALRASSAKSTPKSRPPSWLLPAIIVTASTLIFAWFFRDYFLPSEEVRVAPVVLITDIEQPEVASPDSTVEAHSGVPVERSDERDFSAAMRFQAAGWFEPDPLPIRATALVDGVVDQVHVLEGEEVTKGQLLASLIAEDTQLKLDAAKRDLASIEAEHHVHLAMIPAVNAEADSVRDHIAAEKAKLEELSDRLERMGNLSKGTISDQELEAARLAVESQKAEVAALQSDLAVKLAKLESINTQSDMFDARIAGAKVAVEREALAHSRVNVHSPVDGIVLELKAAPGQKKMLGMDDPDSATIAVLFETGKLQARVDVPLADASGLVPGQAAMITTDFLPNAEFRGRVTRIVGSADLQRNTLQAKVRVFDPDPRLRPEMLCRVKFLQAVAGAGTGGDDSNAAIKAESLSTSALFVPVEALFDRSDENGRASVWAVDAAGTSCTRKLVELGKLKIENHVLVRSGLRAGERVILPPHDQLAEGRRVRISQPRN